MEGVVYATLPAADIERLNDLDGLAYAAPQPMYEPSYALGKGAVVSEGVRATAADRFHQAGILGKGVKVGILDFGFTRYQELQDMGELPPPVATKAFTDSGQLDTDDNFHGTACAEIIHDMAPEASLYLAAANGREDQLIQTAYWLANQGVDIISFSGGGHRGPHNGSAILDRLVELLVKKHGILWVNAAGNEGQEHWLGQTIDADGNGFVDTETNDRLLIKSGPGGFGLILNWDDWGADPTRPTASQDIDMYLFAMGQDGKPELVAHSNYPQQGRGQPLEVIAGDFPPGDYLLMLKAASIGQPVKVHLYTKGNARVHPSNAVGSIGIPATAVEALAVGAVDVRDGRLESFSSQGPSDDNRLKPDVVAPDHNLSVAYGQGGTPGRFTGTSAACPHVSGFAALVKSMSPSLSQLQLRTEVERHVRAMGPSSPNNMFGNGHIDAKEVAVKGAEYADEPPPEDQPEGIATDEQQVIDSLRDVLRR